MDSDRPQRTAATQGGELSGADLELVSLLQADGRMAYSELARRCGVTEKTVRRRVAALLEDGAVHIAAVTEPSLLGYGAVSFVCVRVDGSRPARDIADELSTFDTIDYVTVTTGRFALVAEVLSGTGVELNAFVDGTIRSLPGVQDVEIMPVVRVLYQQARFEHGAHGGGVRPRALDEDDRTIIRMLAADGRVPLREIAARLDVSETKVRKRFTNLTQNAAMQVMAIANPLRLGYRAVAWLAIRVAPGGRADAVADELAGVAEVSYVTSTLGRFDLLVECVCHDLHHLIEVLESRVRTISDVASTEPWVYVDLHYKPLRPREPSGPGP